MSASRKNLSLPYDLDMLGLLLRYWCSFCYIVVDSIAVLMFRSTVLTCCEHCQKWCLQCAGCYIIKSIFHVQCFFCMAVGQFAILDNFHLSLLFTTVNKFYLTFSLKYLRNNGIQQTVHHLISAIRLLL